MAKVVVTGLLLASSWIAGCATTDEDGLTGLMIPALHSFTAATETRARQYPGFVNLSGPEVVVALDGTPVQAYRLEQVTFVGGGTPHRRSWFLDVTLHEVARLEGCGYVYGPCQRYEDWSWSPGSLPPLGFGYPTLIKAGALEVVGWSGTRYAVPWSAEVHESGRLLITATERDWAGNGTSQREFVFEDNRLLPDSKDITVLSYVAGSALRGADPPLARPRPEGPAAWQGLMFRDEATDPFGIGATFRDIALFAVPSASDNSSLCVQYFHLWVFGAPPESPLDPIVTPTPHVNARAWIDVITPGQHRFYEVEVTQARSTDPVKMVVTDSEEDTASTTCEDLRRSPWPRASFADALAKSRAIFPGERLAFMSHRIAAISDFPESGGQEFKIAFKPLGPGGSVSSEFYTLNLRGDAALHYGEALVPPGTELRAQLTG